MEIFPQNSIRLYKDVPFQPDYTDVRYFEDVDAREHYFTLYQYDGKIRDVEHTMYVRENRTIKVDIPINDCYQYNYIRFINESTPLQDGQSHYIGANPFTFYAWITGYHYKNKNVTELSFQVDVFTTYFPYCTIDQLTYHVRKNQHKDSNGYYRLTTQPEPMEIGNSYRCMRKEQLFPDMEYVTLLCSSAYLKGNFGTISNPNLTTSKGCTVGGIPSCLDFYIVEDVETFLDYMSDYPWVTRCFQNLTYIPKEMTDLIDKEESTGLKGGVTRIISASGIYKRTSQSIDLSNYYPSFKNYQMTMYPYSVIQVTDYAGNEIILKPENFIESNDNIVTYDVSTMLKNLTFDYYGYISATPRFVVVPFGYNTDVKETNNYPSQIELTVKGDFFDNALIQANYPQLPILTDEYLLYMASNAHTRAYQSDYIQYKQNFNDLQNSASTITSAIGGLGQLASGDLGGAMGTIANAGVSAGLNYYSNVQESNFSRRAIQAQQQDMKLTAPSVQSQVDGIAFNIANNIKSPTVNLKCIKPEYWNRVDNYLSQFGCQSLSFEKPVFKDRIFYNYLQLQEPFVTVKSEHKELVSLSLPIKTILQQIFINGVRLWHNDDMGNYNLENGEV